MGGGNVTERIRFTYQNTLTNAFYQLPKFLFDDEFSSLNNNARVLYTLLYDRIKTCRENGWYDERGELYIYFKRKEMQSLLRLSEKTVTKIIKDLEISRLLEDKQQGYTKPNKIYLLTVDDGTKEKAQKALIIQ